MIGYIYMMGINLTALCMFCLDKQKAKKGRWRIPEKTLLGTALIGGSLGAFLGMKICHHKTKKKKFSVGIPIILIMQVIVVCLVHYYIK